MVKNVLERIYVRAKMNKTKCYLPTSENKLCLVRVYSKGKSQLDTLELLDIDGQSLWKMTKMVLQVVSPSPPCKCRGPTL
jgi:hypothetical protein